VDRDPVTQDDLVFQIQGEEVPSDMEDAGVLDGAARADPDRVDIASQQTVEPNIGFRSEFHVTDDRSIPGNKNGSIKLWALSLEIQNHCFSFCTGSLQTSLK